MADGINIEGGFDDIDLSSDFLDGTIKGVMLQFAADLQTDLRQSIERNKLTYTGELAQSVSVVPKILELEDKLVYILEMPWQGAYLNEGVSGTKTKVTGSSFSFKSEKPSSGMVEALSQWGRTKFGLNMKENKSFGWAAAKNKLMFGIKPTFWLSDVVQDGRIQKLEEEIGKKIAFAIIDRA